MDRRRDFSNPTDAERLHHMVEAIDRLQELSARFAPAKLLTEALPQSVACRCFGIVAEAAAGTSPAFRRAHPAVGWPRWIRYGRRLVHGYFQVNYQRMWQHWQPATMPLRQQVAAILTQEAAVPNV